MAETTLLSGSLKLAGRLDSRFFDLLEAIDRTGSLNRAARTAGYSYKGAWLLLENAAALAQQPLVERVTGGHGGGGTCLTQVGRDLQAAWQHMNEQHQRFLVDQETWLNQQPTLAVLLRRIAMKTTARNQFSGRIGAIEAGPITTQVRLDIQGGLSIVSTLTSSAAQRMNLAIDQEAIALVKSSAVVLVTDFAGYTLSARNQFEGTLSRLEQGEVASLAVLTLPGGATITASVTNDAVEALGLAVGQPVTAVFKAYSVMLAVAQR